MPKPNLFIVGAPKCGTTAWVEYLQSHPDIFFCDIKEPHYFAFDLPGFRWISSLAEYEKLFARAGGAKILGDASVMYLYSGTAAQAIRDYNPDAKILIFLRDQEDFLPSLHHQYLYSFRESIEDFGEAWRLSGKRSPESIPSTSSEPKLLDYAAVGRFREQIDRYFAAFPHDRIRVIRFEDWTRNPRSIYLQLLDFLGLDDDGRTEFPRVNVAKTHRSGWLGRLILHPPGWARSIVNLVKKVTGRSTLRLSERAAKLIEVPGYKTRIDPETRAEIRAYYGEENKLLEEQLAASGCLLEPPQENTPAAA